MKSRVPSVVASPVTKPVAMPAPNSLMLVRGLCAKSLLARQADLRTIG
jgi:hypothetical protein